MSVSYKKLWKLLIDRDMTRTELRKKINVSTTTLARMGKDENVGTDVLAKICNVLRCDVGDIVEMIPDDIPKDE